MQHFILTVGVPEALSLRLGRTGKGSNRQQDGGGKGVTKSCSKPGRPAPATAFQEICPQGLKSRTESQPECACWYQAPAGCPP